jgi:hypothetical protein
MPNTNTTTRSRFEEIFDEIEIERELQDTIQEAEYAQRRELERLVEEENHARRVARRAHADRGLLDERGLMLLAR